jgi:hypothetical protein
MRNRSDNSGIRDSQQDLAVVGFMENAREAMMNCGALDYDAFLEQRRKLIAAKMQNYFKSLRLYGSQ